MEGTCAPTGMWKIHLSPATTSEDRSNRSLRPTIPSSNRSNLTRTLDAGASWKGGERWLFGLGGKVYGGSDIHGGDLSLYLPYASAEYAFDSLTRGRVWYNPELSLAPYYERIEEIPYASREIDLRPE